ncbi:MAG: hypothetical protein CL693_04005 [Cellvibrionaceae bacterium]|nr:hypothetical protein [Cellvibrionaceae bacterium]
MKLPDFLEFEPFNTIRQRMDAQSLGDFVFFDPRRNLTGLERSSLDREGLDIDDQDLRVGEDFTLIYKDSRVLMFCTDPQLLTDRYYHLADCERVAQLRQTDLSQSRWQLRTREPQTAAGQYQVCSGCLQRLHYQNYDGHRQRHRDYSDRVLEAFNLEEFFSQYPMYPVSMGHSAPVF